jgi:hypothetical protein
LPDPGLERRAGLADNIDHRMANRPSYSFEEWARKESIRAPEVADQTLGAFAERLGIAKTPATLKELLRDYVLEIHLNIDWYVRRLERERALQWMFTMFSVVLLIGIPPLIAWLSHRDDTKTVWTAAQITAMITGILAIHKTLAAWVDKRQLFGHFWRTSAELKELLYSFEQRWHGKALADTAPGTASGTAPGTAPNPEFVQALQADVARARQIVRAERQGFYDLFQSPAFDVFQRLNDALSHGQALGQQFRSPVFDERAAREQDVAQRKQSIDAVLRRKRELDAQIHGYDRLARELATSLASAGDAERARVEQNIDVLHQNIDQARRDLIKVEAELAALSER